MLSKKTFYPLIGITLLFLSSFLLVRLMSKNNAASTIPQTMSIKNEIVNSSLLNAGKMLFESNRLSNDNSMSCASCHDPHNFFQDGIERAFARGLFQKRNTPTLLNTNRYDKFFWDGRATNLTEQIKGPLFNKTELSSNSQAISQAVQEIPNFRNFFYDSDKSREEFVVEALAYYIKSLTTQQTKYSQYMAGVKNFSNSELRGLDLFSGKAGCQSCHTAPDFTDNKFHDTGLFRRKIIFETVHIGEMVYEQLGTDRGRGDVVGGKENLYTFRTPSLYNVVLTAPYMHDGSLQTLEAVIDFYNRGGDIEKGRKLDLSEQEKDDLVAFLNTLTDIRYSSK
jgi:cytochrome c peroxidase